MNKGWAIAVAALVTVGSICFIKGQTAAGIDEAMVQIESNTKWSTSGNCG